LTITLRGCLYDPAYPGLDEAYIMGDGIMEINEKDKHK
jgi:hypothetical protein